MLGIYSHDRFGRWFRDQVGLSGERCFEEGLTTTRLKYVEETTWYLGSYSPFPK
jgi:hypothetical protein